MDGDRQLAEETDGHTSNDTAVAFKTINIDSRNFLSAKFSAGDLGLNRGHDGIVYVEGGVMTTPGGLV